VRFVVLISLAVVAATTAAIAAGAANRVVRVEGSLQPGRVVTVSGQGFNASERLTIYFGRPQSDSRPKARLRANASGEFRWRYKIPVSTAPGPMVFMACGPTFDCARRTVRVVARAGELPRFAPPSPVRVSGQIRPRNVLLSATGDLRMNPAKWENWSKTRASAHGTGWVRGCEPTCAEGTLYKASARLTLTAPVRIQPCRRLFFTRATLEWIGTPPPPVRTQRRAVVDVKPVSC
jgi:hypothetical protein